MAVFTLYQYLYHSSIKPVGQNVRTNWSDVCFFWSDIVRCPARNFNPVRGAESVPVQIGLNSLDISIAGQMPPKSLQSKFYLLHFRNVDPRCKMKLSKTPLEHCERYLSMTKMMMMSTSANYFSHQSHSKLVKFCEKDEGTFFFMFRGEEGTR